MSRFPRVLAVLALAPLWLAAPTLAQEKFDDAPPDIWFFSTRVSPGLTLDTFQERLREDFGKIGSGGETVSLSDIADYKTILDAQRRGSLAGSIMSYDLNGDGFVSKDEVLRRAAFDRRTRGFSMSPAERQVEIVMQLDKDGDGKVGWLEAAAIDIDSELWLGMMPDQSVDPAKRIRRAMSFDADKDGVLTLAEFLVPAEAIFHRVDTDQSGELSKPEVCAFVDTLAFLSMDDC